MFSFFKIKNDTVKEQDMVHDIDKLFIDKLLSKIDNKIQKKINNDKIKKINKDLNITTTVSSSSNLSN
jgi:methyltransferase-like protein